MPVPDRKRWKALEAPPLTGGRLVADRLLMVLFPCVLIAAVATTVLKSGPAPVADAAPRPSLHIVWIAAANDRLDLPFLPYASASRAALQSLANGPDETEGDEATDVPLPLKVTPISASTEAQVRSALREALADHAPGDSLLVYVRGHLVPGVGGGRGTSLVCGDARLTATPAGDAAEGKAKADLALKGILPIADLVTLMDAAPARCRLMLLEPGALPLEPALGVYLDDYLAGLAAPGRVDVSPAADDAAAVPGSETGPDAAPTSGGITTIVLSRPPHAGEFLRPDRSATRFFAAVRETLAAPAAADKNKDQSLSLGEFRTALSRGVAPDRPIAIRSGRLVTAENPAADADPLLSVVPDKAASEASQPAVAVDGETSPQRGLLDSIRRSRSRLEALMRPPEEPGPWPLLSMPRRMLSVAARLARTEEQVLFEPHSSAELTDIEIGLQKVERDLDAIERESKPIEAAAGTSRDLWQAWAEFERSRPMLIDAVRLHDRIGHLPRMEWLSPAVEQWGAALTNDAAQFESHGKPAVGAKAGPRVRRISLQGPDVKARLVERPLADLVSELVVLLGSRTNASRVTAEGIAIVQGLLQSDLLTVEQRMQLMEGLVELRLPPSDPPAVEAKTLPIEVPDFALHRLAKKRFELHRMLIVHFLGDSEVVGKALLIDELATELAEAGRGPVLVQGSDAGYLGVVYRTMLEIPGVVEEAMYVVPVPPVTTPLNE